MIPTRPPLVYNKLCSKCLRHCKQQASALLLECPRYLARPFKSPTYRFDQLDLFAGEPERTSE